VIGPFPIEAKDVSGSPPTYIVTAGFDPLRQDGVDYAEKLKSGGVSRHACPIIRP